MEKDPAAGCPPCPKCGGTRTRYTVKAIYGTYCYCDSCANAWYHEAPPPPDPSEPRPKITP
jgi:hypothetical protein